MSQGEESETNRAPDARRVIVEDATPTPPPRSPPPQSYGQQPPPPPPQSAPPTHSGGGSRAMLYLAIGLVIAVVFAGLFIYELFQYQGLQFKYSMLQSQYNSLESTYSSLNTSCTILKNQYNTLESTFMPIWNMPKDGFRQLYDQLPGAKPPFEDVWRWTGGNPRVLERLSGAGWSVDRVIYDMVRRKRLAHLVASLTPGRVEALRRALEDPDVLLARGNLALLKALVGRNLVVDGLYRRDPALWLDAPPSERDPELGISRRVAWQTPLHKEAVRRALEVHEGS